MRCARAKKLAAAVLLVVSTSSNALAGTRGYAARPCGMDTNHDGVIGGAGDCDVCDSTSGDTPGLVGPEGWAEWYVSSATGTDTPRCGSPAAPCATIDYALTARTPTGQPSVPNAVCFTGTLTAEQTDGDVVPSGPDGTYTVSVPGASGDVVSWTLPSKPTLIMGWDHDDDGAYPPYDRDDTAVIDGCPNKLYRTFALVPGGASNIEFAHFTAKNYGSSDCVGTLTRSTSIGFFQASYGADNFYQHDVAQQNINRGQPKCDANRVYSLMYTKGQRLWHNFRISNSDFRDTGGYLLRGGVGSVNPSGERGPIMLDNVSYTANGCPTGTCPDVRSGCGINAASATSVDVSKLWGFLTGQYYLRNVVDTRNGHWGSRGGGGTTKTSASAAFVIDDGVRDVSVVDNTIKSFFVGVYAEPFVTAPNLKRPIQNVVVDGNIITQDPANVYAITGTAKGIVFAGVPGTSSASYDHVENVKIVNNVIDLEGTSELGILVADASQVPCGRSDTYLIANNTLHGRWRTCSWAGNSTCGAIVLGQSSTQNTRQPIGVCVPKSIDVRNNVVDNLNTSVAVYVNAGYVPVAHFSHNAYSPSSYFGWSGTSKTWEEWRAAHETAGRRCTPKFVDAESGDLRLTNPDACGKAGSTTSGVFSRDGEGNSRPKEPIRRRIR